MKTLKILGKWILVSFIFALLWGIAMQIASQLMGITLPSDDNGDGLLSFLFASSVNAGVVILLLLPYTRRSFWARALYAGGILFVVQFFLSQIETWWFKDSVSLSDIEILSILLAGALLSVLFGIIAALLFPRGNLPEVKINLDTRLLPVISIAVVLVYPMIYFLAGYFIAFQSEELRIYYTNSAELPSFRSMLFIGIANGLYVFQIARGLLWASLAWWIFSSSYGSALLKSLLVGLAFSMLLCSQLVIPNHAMPETIRWMHFAETASSTFLWGFVITFAMDYFGTSSTHEYSTGAYFH